MRSKHVTAAFTALFFLSDPVAAQLAEPKWGAHVDVEAKPGTKRNIGEMDFFLPLWQDNKTLLFGNARLRLADHDNKEGNIGLGVRRMLGGGWNIGGYGYFDRRRTSTGSKFNQATFGAEALGRDFDFRGNVYLPQGDRVRELGTTTVGGGTPTAAIIGATVQVTTPGSTTFTSEERALKGYDLEAGWRLPIWAAEADKQLRLYAGGYHFSDNGIRVSGPRVRAELAMYDLPALWKGAQLMLGAEYQDDNARGGQGFVSVRLRIPLGAEKDSGRRMNWQARRMAAPVVRDVDIVTQGRSVVTATTPAVVETATQTSGGQAITVLDSGTTPGANLPAAITAAGADSTVILSGSFTGVTNMTLQNGQTLMAGAMAVSTPSGRTATLTTSATLAISSAGGNAIEMAPNSTLTGLTIGTTDGGTGVNILGNGAVLSNSIITNTQSTAGAFGVIVGGATNVTVSGNTIVVVVPAGQLGEALQIVSINAATSATVMGNTLSASGSAFIRHTLVSQFINPLTILPGSTGNTILSGACVSSGAPTGSISYTNGPNCP